MDSLPNLKLISYCAVGYDTLDIKAAKERGIIATHTPEVLNDSVAELAVGMMITLARELVRADAFVRSGKWKHEPLFSFANELNGAKVGIWGLGRIGMEIARRCEAFRMQVCYHGRNERPEQPYRFYKNLKEMAHAVDWLIAAVPATSVTNGTISQDVLTALGPRGFFVNIGRGALVDEPALLKALNNRTIAGAALDVFWNETDINPAFFALDNTILTPHIGTSTHRTDALMSDLALENAQAVLKNSPVKTPIW